MAGASKCLPYVEALESIFSTWGESEHWALILQGLGTCQDGRLHTAKALPYLVWTGGDQMPEKVEVTFEVQGITCVHGTVGTGPGKVNRIADCKLVFPGQGLLTAAEPQELVRAITRHGRFTVSWNGRREQIQWR